MNRRFSVPFFLTIVFAVIAAALRLWSLHTAVDALGLPAMHLSIYILIGVSLLFLLLAVLFASRSKHRNVTMQELSYDRPDTLCGYAASMLILMGAILEFALALRAGPTLSAPIICLLGILGGICCYVTVRFRHQSEDRYPATELIPVVYILIKLMLNFKSWSVDPIILDYCVILFALIFTLLAFFYGAGFVLELGKPRRTLFCAMAAVFFCAAAMMDGIAAGSSATVISYAGFLLWQLPVVRNLLRPAFR